VPFSWADGRKDGWHRIFKGAMPEIATAARWIESLATELDPAGTASV